MGSRAHPRASTAISRDRLWSRLMELSEIGAIAGGGVCRLALSPEDAQARRLLCSWARARGYRVYVDAAANLFVRREGLETDSPPVLTGSHLDTQPAGGRFDGAYGVLAGLEVLEALDDAGVRTRRPLEVVAWTNEEGARYAPGAMGSMAFAGALRLDDILDRTASDGTPLRQALAETLSATPEAERRHERATPAAYVEAHIEQGPRLEAAGLPIGIVDGIQGVRWFDILVHGTAAHAGTTPRGARRDAVQDAIRVVNALNLALEDGSDVLRFTVGRFSVHPDSRNTVAERVAIAIDIRHPDSGQLAYFGDLVPGVCRSAVSRCEVEVREVFHKPPARFDAGVTRTLEDCAKALELPSMSMPSGAFHDAFFLNDICPSGMLFIPCEGGISHHPSENITPEQAETGARVLAEALVCLAR